MKILKRILIGLLVFIGLLLIAALILPKKYEVHNEKEIRATPKAVMDYIRMFKNQEEYSEWLKPDSGLKPTIEGTDGEVGAVQKWDSKIVGKGSQTITAITDNNIELALHFDEPFEGDAKVMFSVVEKSPGVTTMTSHFSGESPFPMNLMSHLFGKSMIRKTEDKNMENIKRILEKP